ncbi:MAG: hypothetical protein Q7T82_17055 [Armatimonadota bacterium]|nr:hypothetical protein [Armatimonadota bacterium]
MTNGPATCYDVLTVKTIPNPGQLHSGLMLSLMGMLMRVNVIRAPRLEEAGSS